jgi:hypothetical protein
MTQGDTAAMQYEVRFVDPDALPDSHDWAMAQQGEAMVLFVKRDRVTPYLLEKAWLGANLLANQRHQRTHGVSVSL